MQQPCTIGGSASCRVSRNYIHTVCMVYMYIWHFWQENTKYIYVCGQPYMWPMYNIYMYGIYTRFWPYLYPIYGPCTIGGLDTCRALSQCKVSTTLNVGNH
jgi:hypothetical protein